MDTHGALEELREADLDLVSAGSHRYLGDQQLGGLFGGLLRNVHFGNLAGGGFFGVNVTQTNTAIEIAIVIGGGSVVQVINQSNVVA